MNELAGIAAVITAVGGILTPLMTVLVILRVNHVVKLTNSNFSALQAALDEALKVNREQAVAALSAARTASEAAIVMAHDVSPPP